MAWKSTPGDDSDGGGYILWYNEDVKRSEKIDRCGVKDGCEFAFGMLNTITWEDEHKLMPYVDYMIRWLAGLWRRASHGCRKHYGRRPLPASHVGRATSGFVILSFIDVDK